MFFAASAWGVLVLTPMCFMFDAVGRQDPPPITHPQFYYGFACAALAWQFAYFLIGTDPERFRPVMIVAVFAKMSYFAAVAVLYLQARLSTRMFAVSAPDALLGSLFLVAFYKTRSQK